VLNLPDYLPDGLDSLSRFCHANFQKGRRIISFLFDRFADFRLLIAQPPQLFCLQPLG
jgi:hypothetical protein